MEKERERREVFMAAAPLLPSAPCSTALFDKYPMMLEVRTELSLFSSWNEMDQSIKKVEQQRERERRTNWASRKSPSPSQETPLTASKC